MHKKPWHLQRINSAIMGMPPTTILAIIAAWISVVGLANATEFTVTSDQVTIGHVGSYVSRPEDTLLDVARTNDLGYTELVAANRGVDPWLPGAGTRIIIPGLHVLPDRPHHGIVIDLAARRLFYFPPSGDRVETYPIGVGTLNRATPVGTTRIVRATAAPTWYPPPSIRAEKPGLHAAVPPGPDNPLGGFAFYLSWPQYLIHGTNRPYGIGRGVSHGCIQLYPEDMVRLSREVRVGTEVRIVAHESNIVYVGDQLYALVHPDKIQADAIENDLDVPTTFPRQLLGQLAALPNQEMLEIDWDAVKNAGLNRDGILVPIGKVTVSHDERKNVTGSVSSDRTRIR
ncbi:MAG: L,D-transpeptidase [Rhodospirillaceae bacterium]|nr:MAG: L,D-transpeptidase [Rhodospirillaceae bacterium]